ncbi:hypothetical protein [Rhizobium leguminosarum]|uniref:hypothetical protein n=1 Tax=Rhizobium TaxID=379 RepID=UPI000164ADAC
MSHRNLGFPRAPRTPQRQFDAQNAAVAVSRGAPLATRNASDFEGLGLQIINPWKDL